MKFGYGLINCEQYPGDTRSGTDLYREALLLAERAEELGFSGVWTTEHHFFVDSYSPSVLPLCAAIAGRTSEIGIGTAVLLAPLYHPIRLAEDAAVVDLLSGGRFILGLALGWRPEEFEGFGVPRKERARRLEDTVKVLRQAWSGELVTGGSLLTYPGVAVRPLPARPQGPPIWLGGFTERAVRRAARLADGLMPNAPITSDEIVSLQDFDEPEHSLGTVVSWMGEELAARDDAPAEFPLAIVTPTFAWPGNGEEAWAKVRDHYCYAMWRYKDMAQSWQRTEPATPLPPLTPEAERQHRASLVVGNPQQVADRLLRLQDDAGVELHIVARLYWPGMTLEDQFEAMRIFAEEVVPRTA